MGRFRQIIVITSLLLIGMSPASVHADDVKPFDKQTATTILELMGNKRVVVGAITTGHSPDSKMVLAVGVRDGKEVKIHNDFGYDNDLGWFYFEFQVTNAKGQSVNTDMPPMFNGAGNGTTHIKLRIWSTAGYKEILVGP